MILLFLLLALPIYADSCGEAIGKLTRADTEYKIETYLALMKGFPASEQRVRKSIRKLDDSVVMAKAVGLLVKYETAGARALKRRLFREFEVLDEVKVTLEDITYVDHIERIDGQLKSYAEYFRDYTMISEYIKRKL